MRTYRVTVFNRDGGILPDYLYITAPNKRDAIREAHQEADRRCWFDRYAIYPHDLVRVCPDCLDEWDGGCPARRSECLAVAA